MKKVFVVFLILTLCLSLAACGGPGTDAAPGKISDVIPYDDAGTEIYSCIPTVGERSVTLLYSEERKAELVELLDSVNLKELPVNEDMDAVKNLHALHISLLIQSGSEKYYITAAGAQNVYLNLWQGDEIVHSCILDINADLIQKLTEINRKVHDYSYDGSGFMEISRVGADIQNLNNADSLYLADIMEAALESGISEDGAENVKAEDFAVKMKLDGQVWYLDPETRMAGKETDGTISAVKMDDRYFLPVMRKISVKLFAEERVAAEVKAAWDAAQLAEQLGKATPYTEMYRHMQVSLGQWQDAETAVSSARAAWLLHAAVEWYAEKEGIMPEQAELDKQLEVTAKSLSSVTWYQNACDQLGITVEDWVWADRKSQDISMTLTAVYTASGVSAEELNDLMKSIQEDYLASEDFERIRPQFERSLELLQSGGSMTAEELLEEDIFTAS